MTTKLETGYVVLGDSQFYQGYTLFLSKKHATELHFLPSKFAVKYLKELMLVAKAVWNAFKPEKLNYELLGNSESHSIGTFSQDIKKILKKIPCMVL